MITIEPVHEGHAPGLQVLLEDPEVTAPTPLPYPYPPDGAARFAAEAMARAAAGTQYAFAICTEGRAVGVTLLKGVDRSLNCAELGYWLGRPWWGRGIATRAAGLTVTHAFGLLNLGSLDAICLADNTASLRVLAHLGFQEVERFLEGSPKWPGEREHVRLRLGRFTWHSPDA